MLGVLFLFAGHSLAASGAPRGRPLPWIAIAALTTVPFFFFQTFRIPGESMEGTLLPGDSILAQTFPRPVPERGKLALFVSPSDPDLVLIKRVIAVPGDRIHIAGKTVILNGTALDEKYVLHDVDQHYGENFPTDSADPGCAEGYEMLLRQTVNGEVVVPSGQYFVLGDRREDSLDSRCWGFVRLDKFIGRPLVIYDSVDQTSEPASGQYQEWEGRRRWARMFKIL
ncbi:MAG TPA: signal peptidase I [Terracidiphilus sp.]